MSPLKISFQKNELTDGTHQVMVSTANFLQVQQACDWALRYKKMVGVVGAPGLGKTLALKYYCAKTPNAFLITVKPSHLAKSFWAEFLDMLPRKKNEAAGRYRTFDHRGLYIILREISVRIRALDSPLFVIDECGKMDARMLGFVHELHDELYDRCGIVLAGPEYWRTNLEKWVAHSLDGIPEFYRRIARWEVLEKPTRREIAKICELRGITDPDTLRVLHAQAQNFAVLQNQIDSITLK